MISLRPCTGSEFSGAIAVVLTSVGLAAAGTDREVVFFSAGGEQLAGSMLSPSAREKEKVPGVVLLAGSGPTDRNGNQPPLLKTDLLKQIADALAEQGIASLRFDKRGMHANAARMPKNPAEFGDYFAWENFVADAVAAVRFLRAQPAIDAAHVGIFGHSEGATLALLAAEQLEKERASPAVLVLLSAPGRPIDALIDEQLRRLLARQKAKPADVEFFMKENARITQAIKSTSVVPKDVPAGLKALYPAYLGKFLHSEMAVEPNRIAGRFAGPVLLVIGGRDVQVSPERDAKRLEAALASRHGSDHRLVVVPGASHNLKAVKSDADPGFAGPVAPPAMEAIVGWTAEKLKRK